MRTRELDRQLRPYGFTAISTNYGAITVWPFTLQCGRKVIPFETRHEPPINAERILNECRNHFVLARLQGWI